MPLRTVRTLDREFELFHVRGSDYLIKTTYKKTGRHRVVKFTASSDKEAINRFSEFMKGVS